MASGKPVLTIIQTAFFGQAGGRPADSMRPTPNQQQEEATPTQGLCVPAPHALHQPELNCLKNRAPRIVLFTPFQGSRMWRC